MALVAGRECLQRLSDDDGIHPLFRLDTQKALISSSSSSSLRPLPSLEPHVNHETNTSTTQSSNQEMRYKKVKDFDDSDIESAMAQEGVTASPERNLAEFREQRNPQDVSDSINPTHELSGPTIAHGKPVRKRRKLGSRSELTGTGKQGTLPWYQPTDQPFRDSRSSEESSASKTSIVVTEEDSPVASAHHKAKVLSDQDAHQSVSTETGGNLPRHDASPAKKVMKLRANGKLFSPPKKDIVIHPLKGGKKMGVEVNKRLVLFKYGDTAQSRREMGETIERILSRTLRIKPLKENKVLDQATTAKIDQSTKVEPHPFFLAPRKLEEQKDHSSALSRSKNTSRASSPHRSTERASEKPAAGLLFGSSALKIVFPNESQEPIWPPREMLHVRHQSFTTEVPATTDRAWTVSTASKAKESAVRLEEAEEIWYPLKNLVNNPKLFEQVQRESEAIPLPERQIIMRSEIQTIVSDLLTTGLGVERHPIAAETDAPSRIYTCESIAAQRLFETLPRSSSAFDNFKCENQGLTTKYAPKSSTEVLQSQKSMQLLKSWLSGSSVHSTSSIASTASIKQKRKSLKKRRQASELDDFIATSEDDDQAEDSDRLDSQTPNLTGLHFGKHVSRNHSTVAARLTAHSIPSTKVVVLSGPHGCGKTAAIYALAQEIGFEVFEINAGSRRSGRDILERVGDMTKNHLVNRLSLQSDTQSESTDEPQADIEDTRHEIASGKQSTMQSFFKKKPVSKPASKPVKTKATDPIASAQVKSKSATETKTTSKSQKQSLILLEEVDVLFEEDKQFWATIISLIMTSKRPIIMTCNDESVLPLEVMAQCSLVRFTPPPMAMVTEYLLLIAAHEGHLLHREAVSSLYTRTGLDLRASIMQLSFWCQMAVKDSMNGLNWILFPQDYQNDNIAIAERRVMSRRTFFPHMGVLGNNQTWSANSKVDAMQWMDDTALEWNLQAEDLMYQDTQLSKDLQFKPSLTDLSTFSSACDVLSAADVLQSTAFLDEIKTDKPFTDFQQFNNFTISPPVLQATPKTDMIACDSATIVTLNFHAQSVISSVQHKSLPVLDYYYACDSIVHRKRPLSEHQAFIRATTWNSLDTLIACDLERLENVATDLAPYIRSIIAYDNRLEQDRNKLDKLLSDGSRSGKRQRTTRASRAALEGGHKASTRRERWFECELDFSLILETGGKDWQEAAWIEYQRDIRRWRWAQQAEHTSSEDELCL